MLWAKYSDTGTITLNLRLIQAPKPHFDYVVHELYHLVEHNHSL